MLMKKEANKFILLNKLTPLDLYQFPVTGLELGCGLANSCVDGVKNKCEAKKCMFPRLYG